MGDEKDLDALFSRFGARKSEERNAAEKADAAQRAFREAAAAITSDVICPVLEELAAELRSRGHRSTVTGGKPNQDWPGVELSFGVGSVTGPSDSVLRFIPMTGPSSFQTEADVRSRRSFRAAEDLYLSLKQKRNFEEIDPAWVRSIVMRFVEFVLEVS